MSTNFNYCVFSIFCIEDFNKILDTIKIIYKSELKEKKRIYITAFLTLINSSILQVGENIYQDFVVGKMNFIKIKSFLFQTMKMD